MIQKTKKLEKGITLIALIITIIVLLILAGVTIATLTGENGLITKATLASEKIKIEGLKEEIGLALTEERIKAETGENLGNKFIYENVWDSLRKNDSKLEVTQNTEDNSYTILYKGYYFKIDEKNNVTYIGEGEKEEETEEPEQPQEPEETEYTITYYKNDGSEIKEEVIVSIGTETSLDTTKFTRDGYKLEGWYTNAECTGDKIEKTNSAIEVYAKWEELTTIETVGSTTIGNVTYTDSYEIWNKAQLQDFRNKVNNGNAFAGCIIKQKADIDLKSENWTPIGDKNTTKPFSGTYDAENKEVQNIAISKTTNYQGLFGYVKGGTVQNLTVTGSVFANSGSAGIVACIEDGKIYSCTNNATVTCAGNMLSGDNFILSEYYWYTAGGVNGIAYGTTEIKECINTGKISAGALLGVNSTTTTIVLGGIVGTKYETTNNTKINISECQNSGEVYIQQVNKTIRVACSGGIVGCVSAGTIENCNNKGIIKSERNGEYVVDCSYSGGISGYLGEQEVIVNKCWNSGNVTNFIAGGIIGNSKGNSTIQNCYNSGNMIADYKCSMGSNTGSGAGGVVCWLGQNNKLINSYNKGEINTNGSVGFSYIGGVVAWNDGTIEKCYNKGKLTPKREETAKDILAGGILGSGGLLGSGGSITDNVNNCYNEGRINWSNGHDYIGGILGRMNNTPKNNNYYNLYNIGDVVTLSASNGGGLIGYWTIGKSWTNYYWLDSTSSHVYGNVSSTDEFLGRATSAQIKALVSNGSLPSTDWATTSTINSGYPHLKVFDDTSIWLRDSNINGGDPYLKDNPPQQ